MKTLFLSIFAFSISILSTVAQNAENSILGSWKGELSVSGTKLPLVFHIQQDENTKNFSSTVDSPAQGAKDIPTSKVTFLDKNLLIEISTLGASYEGKLIRNFPFCTEQFLKFYKKYAKYENQATF